MAERLGQPLMPWQQMVADVGGELDPATGLPAYREVIVLVPRQSGKTTLVLSWNLQRALGWGRPQRIVYSAQTGNDARKKLIEDQLPILEPRKAKLGIRRIRKGMGNEAVEFRNGSMIVLLASSEDSGHGKTVHLGDKDEFFADYDDRRDQALVPAMATVADAQTLTTSTMGTDRSVPLNRAVKRGRQLATAQLTNVAERQGTAYFEWSADPEIDDPDDPEVWWRVMPALGYTITEEVVRHARSTLTDGEFWRAFLNVGTNTDERLIPEPTWDMVNKPDVAPAGAVVFGADMNPERSAAAITFAGRWFDEDDDAEFPALEVVEHRPGAGWLVARCVALKEKWDGAVFAVDGSARAPIASLVPELRAAGLTVTEVTTDWAAACGGMYDAIVEAQLRVRRHASLDAAVAALEQRWSGDGFTWDRRGGADISPFVAGTAALWVSRNREATPGVGGDVDEDEFEAELARIEEDEARALAALEGIEDP